MRTVFVKALAATVPNPTVRLALHIGPVMNVPLGFDTISGTPLLYGMKGDQTFYFVHTGKMWVTVMEDHFERIFGFKPPTSLAVGEAGVCDGLLNQSTGEDYTHTWTRGELAAALRAKTKVISFKGKHTLKPSLPGLAKRIVVK